MRNKKIVGIGHLPLIPLEKCKTTKFANITKLKDEGFSQGDKEVYKPRVGAKWKGSGDDNCHL